MTDEDAATVAFLVLVIIDIVTVAGRFYSRWSSKAGFGWDDWTILIAMMAGVLPGALTVWANSVDSTGPAAASNLDPNHVYTPADIIYTKITFSTTLLYFFIAATIKLSLLLLLHRIFAVSKSFRIQIYVAEAIVVAWWIGASVTDLCNCIPLEWTWKNGAADPKYCINYNTFWLATGVFESVIDLLILALPFGMVSKLQLDRKKKYGVASIFLLGSFVLCSGVAKVVLSYLPNSREPNFGRAALWTVVHLYTGILCANLPASRPLFTRVARLSNGSWIRLSSLGKRWYGSRSADSFTDKEVTPQSTPMTKSWDYNRPISVEVRQDDYELGMYEQPDGHAAHGTAKLTAAEHSPLPVRN